MPDFVYTNCNIFQFLFQYRLSEPPSPQQKTRLELQGQLTLTSAPTLPAQQHLAIPTTMPQQQLPPSLEFPVPTAVTSSSGTRTPLPAQSENQLETQLNISDLLQPMRMAQQQLQSQQQQHLAAARQTSGHLAMPALTSTTFSLGPRPAISIPQGTQIMPVHPQQQPQQQMQSMPLHHHQQRYMSMRRSPMLPALTPFPTSIEPVSPPSLLIST